MSTSDYQEARADLEATFGMVPPPLDSIPDDDVVSEWPTFKKYTVGDSEIPAQYRELMGLAVAANIKCPYCTHFHTAAARLHGATDAQLEEAFSLASFTARYSAMLHAMQMDLDEFEQAVGDIGEHLQEQAAADD
jgi:AhpD family alkylhydroperoxidase